jgi:hypothetical protein
LLLAALAGAALFLKEMNGHYPIDKWLFWIYAQAWLWTLVFGAACLCAGERVVALVLTPRLALPPLRERLLLSMAVGVFIFATGLFVVGLLHGLGPVFFFAWPLGLIAFGVEPVIRRWARVVRLLPHARRVAMSPSWWGGVALVFGLGGVALLYINILTPANVAYDSRWYHLAIAENYVAAGAITPFPEGWFCATYPHLASLLYTWALLVPGADLVVRIETAAHIEFLLFLVTLSGIAVLVRWLTAGGTVRTRNAWAAIFLFPGILLYDSTLSVAADHVLAFWAPVLFLLLRRLLKQWQAPVAVLLGMVMAAALMTKYQAVSLILVPSLVVAGAGVRRAIFRGPRGAAGQGAAPVSVGRALGMPVLVASSVLVLSAPLWLPNWIWHGSPLYPMLRDVFTVHPWVPGTDPGKLLQEAAWTPQGPFLDRVLETLKATVTFSFVAHDWWNHHGTLPIFGSLFTLSLPLLLFLGPFSPRRRVLGLAAATMIGVAIWYWTYHQDRYLQALVPWMAAVVAAVLAMAWSSGWAGRVAAAALVLVQVVWGGDVYTIPTHGMLQTQPARAVLDLISSGWRKDWAARQDSHMEYAPVAPLLPKGSVVLIHERMTRFGTGARVVVDMPGTQGAISYSTLGTPRKVWELLRSFGVTHVLWARGSTQSFQSSVDDLVFFEFVEKFTTEQRDTASGFVLGKMPLHPPPEVSQPRLVRAQLCGKARTVLLDQLDAALRDEKFPDSPFPGPPAFHVTQAGCGPIPPETAAAYRLLANRSGYDMYALK